MQSFFSHHSLQNFISSFSLHHFIVSFNPDDIYIKGMLPKTAEEICALWGTEFQIVYPLFEQKLLHAF